MKKVNYIDLIIQYSDTPVRDDVPKKVLAHLNDDAVSTFTVGRCFFTLPS